jgi:SAM-dependent methyltransferase
VNEDEQRLFLAVDGDRIVCAVLTALDYYAWPLGWTATGGIELRGKTALVEPRLQSIRRSRHAFDLVLLSAVWMHVRPQDRDVAIRTLVHLLRPNGILVISILYGRLDPIRKYFPVSMDELISLGERYRLQVIRQTTVSPDWLKRREIQWQTIVLKPS